MKNIYIRAGMSPFESFPAQKILLNNSIGTNVGNFLYVYGILRNITQDDTSIKPNYYKSNYTDAEIDEINQTQDIFIIPLADAFRSDFVKSLEAMTKLVKKLTIPCVIIGVGLRAPFEPDFSTPYSFDNAVKAFVSAVLEKSSIVGVRGEITSAYLSHLGFQEGTDHMAIGCPSMYTAGPNLTIRDANITADSRVCINSSVTTPDNVHEFLERVTKEFADWHFVPQVLSELRLLYTGSPYIVKCNPLYPTRITDETYRSGRSEFFLNVPTWFEYMSHADLSIGSRLHGNISAILSGTPSILIPKDARVRELSEYHDITRVNAADITADTNVWDLIHSVDFQQPCRRQEENFNRFLGFLEKNGIPHIYQNGTPETIPFMERMKEVNLQPSVKSFAQCSLEEMSERFESFYPKYEKKLKKANPPQKKEPAPAPASPAPAPAAPAESGGFFSKLFKK
jgi:polysaccharide pyruvyl transferase WcaK-like protein